MSLLVCSRSYLHLEVMDLFFKVEVHELKAFDEFFLDCWSDMDVQVTADNGLSPEIKVLKSDVVFDNMT